MDLDPDIANWVLEHLLREPLKDNTLKSLLRALPPNDNPNIKKLLLLKKLESITAVSEETLELLYQLEELNFQRGNETASDAMKRAFCAVAVECTVRHLKGGERYGFFDAAGRVWVRKAERLKIFGSEALWEWKEGIEKALWDSEAANGVMKRSEGVNGVEAVRVYVREEREKMGPSFLEIVVQSAQSDELLQGILGIGGVGKEAQSGVSEVVNVGGIDQEAPSFAVNEGVNRGGIDQEAPPFGVDEVVNRGGCDQEGPSSGVNEVVNRGGFDQEGPSSGVNEDVNRGGIDQERPSSDVNEVVKGGFDQEGPSSGVNEVVSRGGIDQEALQSGVNEVVDRGGIDQEAAPSGVNGVINRGMNKGKTKLRLSQLMQPRGVKIVDLDETTNGPSGNFTQPPASSTHPLRGETSNAPIPSFMERNSTGVKIVDPDETTNGQSGNSTQPPASSTPPPRGETSNAPSPRPSSSTRVKIVDPDETTNGPSGNSTQPPASSTPPPRGETSNAPRPSFMERNNTAQTWEWVDSVDDQFPSPPRRNASPPLNQDQFAVNGKKKRKKRSWSVEEENALIAGVKKWGKGEWKVILQKNPGAFQRRTYVNLKDKWRTMMG